MKKLMAMVVSTIGLMAASVASTGCIYIIFDEPKATRRMLTK